MGGRVLDEGQREGGRLLVVGHVEVGSYFGEEVLHGAVCDLNALFITMKLESLRMKAKHFEGIISMEGSRITMKASAWI